MTTERVLVNMRHVRKARLCSRGVRDFLEKHGLDWQAFLKEGIDADLLIATGDAMAIKVAEVAKNG